jgi:ABC-type glutathione transport system ATPase component
MKAQPLFSDVVRDLPPAVPVIETRDLTKIYRMGDTEVRALNGVSVQIDKGEFVASSDPADRAKVR